MAPDSVPVGYTVTDFVVVQPATVVKVIVAVPPEAPPTVPPELLIVVTVATSVLLLLHVPPPGVPSTSDNVWPWHTVFGASDIATSGLTVTG